jgi:DNA-binding transcriptional MerR regulator
MTEMLTIGQVGKAAGVSASAIRYYERHQILPEPARVGGKRRYDADVLHRLSVLDVAKQAGWYCCIGGRGTASWRLPP